MEPSHKDLYSVLGVERSSNLHVIHDAYRRLAKQYHPDYAGEAATEKFREIQEAYEVLSDHDRRHRYDRELAKDVESRVPISMGHQWDTRKRRSRFRIAPEPLLRPSYAESLFEETPGRTRFRGNQTVVDLTDLEALHSVLDAALSLRIRLFL
jgi:DnaJ-class molecular chaperone